MLKYLSNRTIGSKVKAKHRVSNSWYLKKRNQILVIFSKNLKHQLSHNVTHERDDIQHFCLDEVCGPMEVFLVPLQLLGMVHLLWLVRPSLFAGWAGLEKMVDVLNTSSDTLKATAKYTYFSHISDCKT